MKKGFTLLELMVASLLLSMLVTVLTMVFNSSSIAWRTGTAGVAELKNVRTELGTFHDIMDDLLPGDLVFFTSYSNCNSSNSSFRSITHVGLYLGNGSFIHASNPTRGVVIDTLWSGYYYSHFWAGCRIITE